MSGFLAVVGAVACVALVGSVVLWWLAGAGRAGVRTRQRRQRVEWEAQAAAYRMHEYTRQAVEQMLDEARRQRGER